MSTKKKTLHLGPIIITAFFILMYGFAFAQNYLVTCQTVHDYTVRLATGTPATTPTPLVSPPTSPQAKGTKCVSLVCTNTDSAAAYAIQLYDNDATNNNLVGTVNVPLSSGNTTAAASVSILGGITGLPVDNGNAYITIVAAHKLMLASTTAITAAKNLDCTAQCCDF